MFGLFKKKSSDRRGQLRATKFPSSKSDGFHVSMIIPKELFPDYRSKVKIELLHPDRGVGRDRRWNSTARLVRLVRIDQINAHFRLQYEEVYPSEEYPIFELYTERHIESLNAIDDYGSRFTLGDERLLLVSISPRGDDTIEDTTSKMWHHFDACFKEFDKLTKTRLRNSGR